MCAIMTPTISTKRSLVDSSSYSQGPLRKKSKMPRIFMSSLPDRMLQSKSCNTKNMNNQSALCPPSPDTTLQQQLKAADIGVQVQSFDALQAFFSPPTAEEIAAYQHDVIQAIRTQDLTTLEQFHSEGRPLKCSNQFGESLLHMACRKNLVAVAKFLVQTARVPLQVCDDYGRTPLHDACWAPTTNFELIDLILSECPDLLYIKDKRGNTPLSYLRQDKWASWNDYLVKKSTSHLAPRCKQLLEL